MTFIKRLCGKRKTLAVLRLSGTIGSRGRDLSLSGVRPLIDKVFEAGDQVALVIDSPGGSPTQSELICDHIRRRADKHNKRVVTFVEDVAASGGYWLALAGDEIRVAPASLIGSIGVVSAGFGFVETLEKLGVERRVVAAGENKVRLDAFSPRKDEDVAWLESLQSRLHAHFIATVRKRRAAQGHALPDNDDSLFNGDVWLGMEAVEIGLVDRVDTLSAYAEREKMQLREVGQKRFPGLRGLIGMGVEAVSASVEDQAMRRRLGL